RGQRLEGGGVGEPLVGPVGDLPAGGRVHRVHPQAGVEIAFEPAELLPRVEGPGARSAFGTAAAGQGEDGDEREQRTPDARWEHGFPFEVHGLAARSARSLLAPADRFTITRSLLQPVLVPTPANRDLSAGVPSAGILRSTAG